MGRTVTDEEWNRRAAVVGIEWRESPVGRSMEPIPARCLTCGHEWTPYPGNVSRGHGCPVCGNRASGRTRATPDAEATRVMREAGVEPLEPYPGNRGTRWRCRCLRCGQEVTPTLGNVAGRQGACVHCRGAAISAALRLDDAEATRRMMDAGAVPTVPYPGRAHIPWPCTCATCGAAIAPTYANATKQGPCVYCRNKAVGDAQRLPESEARARAEAWGYSPDPHEPFPGTTVPWPGTCKGCGGRIAPRLGGYGRVGCCSACAEGGFDGLAPALVYLIRLDTPPMLKVGVANDGSGRLAQHERRGWEAVKQWPVATGREALAVEALVVRWWSDAGLRPCERDDVPKGDGYTESVHVGELGEPETLAFIESLLKDVRTTCEPDPPNSAAP